MLSILCLHCGAKLNVPEAALGKKGRCPKCQQSFVVQVPAPVNELNPLEVSPAPLSDLDPLSQPLPPLEQLDPFAGSAGPLGNLDPLSQPLPPLDAMSLGQALPGQAAARSVA